MGSNLYPPDPLSGRWITYNPTWAATGGTPAVGGAGGGLSGEYVKIGEVCHVSITCALGASPTGLGTTTLWNFSLPFTAPNGATGTALFYDATSSIVVGFLQRTAGGSSVYPMTDASAYVGYAAPFTWAANDYMILNATYKVAA